jgi:predicted enzyme related to lactoylglutathione lyase
MTISILGVDNVILAVGDLDEARSFYEGVLGLRVKFADDEHGIVGFAIGEEEPGLVIRSHSIEECPPRQTPRVWLEVPDAREAASALASAGQSLVAPPFHVGTGWTVELADPWGNVIGLTDYVSMPSMARIAGSAAATR